MEAPCQPNYPCLARRIPLAVKLAFTGFTAVLVPFYWITYGPTNFLYYCDVALLLTLAAVWTEILYSGRDAGGGHSRAAKCSGSPISSVDWPATT